MTVPTSFNLATPEEHFFKEAVTQSVSRIFCKKHSAHSRVPAAHCDLEQVSHRNHGGRGVHEQKKLTSELQGKVQLGGRKTEFVLHFRGGARYSRTRGLFRKDSICVDVQRH